ncbi:MAG: hypothetical protein DCC45_06915 [Armatimonadetes bacterium]|nr:MAG: hypothetical protein EDM73_09820 [Armatimonadota bacterium]MBC6970656.1 hypothetical protein [Armatimonadota bacterium]RIJ96386.1 MAG: hypothetical protein DCC45_06915 [Armatimonadota bacterium]
MLADGARSAATASCVAQMKLLIDTNILIPLEPTAASEITRESERAVHLSQLASLAKCTLWLHPA